MGTFAEKAKRSLDWLQHAYLLAQILGSGAVGKGVKAILVTYTHLSSVWIAPIWLAATAFAFLLFTFIGNRLRSGKSGQHPMMVAQNPSILPVQSPVNFDAAEHFRLAYHSDLTAEGEKNIKLAAAQNQPDDREGFLAKIIGIGMVSYVHDLTWAYIFKSQILMITELNRRNGMMPLADAKSFYDEAAIACSKVYVNYSFDQWIKFVITQQLVLKHPSDMLEITMRGKDFLKYLTHWGRYADERSC
jgi:hypothetical protein